MLISLKSQLKIEKFFFLISLILVALTFYQRGFFLSLITTFLGLSALFYVLRFTNHKYTLSFIWSFLFVLSNTSWLSTTTYHGPLIFFVYLLLSIFLSILLAFSFSFFFSKKFSFYSALLISSLVTINEWSRLYYFSGFPFSLLGLVLDFHPCLTQTASLFGVYFLTFIWVIFSYLLAFQKYQEASVLGFSLIIFGLTKITYYENNHHVDSLDVALLQLGIRSEEKWYLEKNSKAFIPLEMQWQRIFEMLEGENKKKYDLIILPEVALGGNSDRKNIFFQDKENLSHLEIAKILSNKYKSGVVLGLQCLEGENAYNSAFYISPSQKKPERYDKHVLVPMSEYLPLSFFSSFLENWGITGFFSKGREIKVFGDEHPFSTSICYEEGFNHLIKKGRNFGANFFVNISNDAWFPNSILNEEHNILGKMRAIENGVFAFRSCNNGITSIIDPFGREVRRLKDKDSSGGFFKGVLSAKICLFHFDTLFSSFGNYPLLSFCFLNLILNFLIKRKSFSRVLTSFSKASRS
jgi:apolipoprotein N-acyltransferase